MSRSVAIVGATGVVGEELLQVLEEFNQDTLQTLSCLQLAKNKTDELNLHQKLRYLNGEFINVYFIAIFLSKESL